MLTKLYEVLSLIEKVLGDLNSVVRVMEHYVSIGDQVEYVNVRVVFPQVNAALTVRQYRRGGVLIAYGYYTRIGNYEEWWDNRPHHQKCRHTHTTAM